MPSSAWGSRRKLARGLLLAAAGMLCAAGDCQRQTPGGEYEALRGAITQVRVDASEFVVQPDERWPERGGDTGAAAVCLLTTAAEVYVNDAYTGVEALTAGDVVDVVGYRELPGRGERLVVSLARVRRAAAAPPEPDIPLPHAPATLPATTQPEEK